MTETGLPLEGVRIVEMTHMVMGPTCGMILAQLGAEVIKVEPPSGDKTRSLGGMGTAFFPLFNRGSKQPTCFWRIFAMASSTSRDLALRNCAAGTRI